MSKSKIIRFTAKWCKPCSQLAPIMNELEKENKDIEFETIDLDENKDLTTKHEVRSIPTLIFFRDGEEVDRLVGGKSKSEIQERIFLLQE